MIVYKSKNGFTLVEVLIALAITGMLLAAVAVAFNASIMNYQENEAIFSTANKTRLALSRMTQQLRTSLVDPNDVANETRCRLICADGSTIRYEYNSTDDKLYLHKEATNSSYVLCDNVTGMTFKKDNDTPTGDVKSVQISMTVAEGNLSKTLSSVAIIRRSLP